MTKIYVVSAILAGKRSARGTRARVPYSWTIFLFFDKITL